MVGDSVPFHILVRIKTDCAKYSRCTAVEQHRMIRKNSPEIRPERKVHVRGSMCFADGDPSTEGTHNNTLATRCAFQICTYCFVYVFRLSRVIVHRTARATSGTRSRVFGEQSSPPCWGSEEARLCSWYSTPSSCDDAFNMPWVIAPLVQLVSEDPLSVCMDLQISGLW